MLWKTQLETWPWLIKIIENFYVLKYSSTFMHGNDYRTEVDLIKIAY